VAEKEYKEAQERERKRKEEHERKMAFLREKNQREKEERLMRIERNKAEKLRAEVNINNSCWCIHTVLDDPLMLPVSHHTPIPTLLVSLPLPWAVKVRAAKMRELQKKLAMEDALKVRRAPLSRPLSILI